MVRPDPAADEIDQWPHVADAALRLVRSKAQDLTRTLRELLTPIGAIEKGEPRRPGQGRDLLAREGGKRRAPQQQGERIRHLSAVIPAGRGKAREPGSMYPSRAGLTDAGVLGSRVSPLSRLARDDSRGARTHALDPGELGERGAAIAVGAPPAHEPPH